MLEAVVMQLEARVGRKPPHGKSGLRGIKSLRDEHHLWLFLMLGH